MVSRHSASAVGLVVGTLGILIAGAAASPALAQQAAPVSLAGPRSDAPSPTPWDNASETVPLAMVRFVPPSERPSALLPMYAGFGVLQIYDYVLTVRGASRAGLRESNPVAARLGGGGVAAIALKGATTASAVFLSERLWKRRRVASVVVMAGINSAMAMVVMHNQRALR